MCKSHNSLNAVWALLLFNTTAAGSTAYTQPSITPSPIRTTVCLLQLRDFLETSLESRGYHSTELKEKYPDKDVKYQSVKDYSWQWVIRISFISLFGLCLFPLWFLFVFFLICSLFGISPCSISKRLFGCFFFSKHVTDVVLTWYPASCSFVFLLLSADGSLQQKRLWVCAQRLKSTTVYLFIHCWMGDGFDLKTGNSFWKWTYWNWNFNLLVRCKNPLVYWFVHVCHW